MKLTLQLVPKSCFYKNVRQILTEKQWKLICQKIYSKYYYQCAICSGVGDKHPVEGHEVWEYDDENYIQKLKEIVALCPKCHLTVHFGFAQIQGKDKEAFDHLRKINNWSVKKTTKYIENEFKIWKKRSQFEWKLDISHLKEYI